MILLIDSLNVNKTIAWTKKIEKIIFNIDNLREVTSNIEKK